MAFRAFIALRMPFFIVGAASAAFFIAFAMGRREIPDDTGNTQSAGCLSQNGYGRAKA